MSRHYSEWHTIDELFISGVFHTASSDQGCPQVTESGESKISEKGGLLYVLLSLQGKDLPKALSYEGRHSSHPRPFHSSLLNYKGR